MITENMTNFSSLISIIVWSIFQIFIMNIKGEFQNQVDEARIKTEKQKISRQNKFVEHMMGVGNELKCHMCKEYFNGIDINTHFLICSKEDNEKDRTCSLCDRVFARKDYIKKHINEVHANKKFECTICGSFLKSKDVLMSHQKLVHEEIQPKCESCEKPFRTNGDLNQHRKNVHQKNKIHKCNTCGKSFSVKGNLINHIKAIHDSKGFKCQLCERIFNIKSNLEKPAGTTLVI